MGNGTDGRLHPYEGDERETITSPVAHMGDSVDKKAMGTKADGQNMFRFYEALEASTVATGKDGTSGKLNIYNGSSKAERVQ